MKRAELVIDRGPDAAHPLHRAVVETDDVTRAAVLVWDRSRGLPTTLSWVDAPPATVEGVLTDLSLVDTFTLSPGERGTYAFVRQSEFAMEPHLAAAWETPTVLPVPPTRYESDWTVTLTLVGTHDALGEIVTSLGEGVDYTVASLSPYRGRERTERLTERQRAALVAAVETGFYDVPRTGTLGDVADRIGCGESTASELVRKAQAAVVREATGFPPRDASQRT